MTTETNVVETDTEIVDDSADAVVDEAPESAEAEGDSPWDEFEFPETDAEADALAEERLEADRAEDEEEVEEEPEEDEESDEKPEEKPEAKKKDDKKPEPKPEQKVKVKVNGKEEDVPLSHLVREYGKAKAAEQKFAEAANIRKGAENLVETLRSDPLRILLDDRVLGEAKFRELAENWLLERITYEQADPAARAAMDNERRVKAYEAQEQARRQAQEQATLARNIEAEKARIDKEFTAALATVKIPKSAGVVRRMAQLAQAAMDNGIEYDAAEIAAQVADEYRQATKEILGGADPEALQEFLGKDKVEALRKAQLEKVRTTNRKPAKKPEGGDRKPAPKKADRHYMTEKEFNEMTRKRVGRR